METVNSCSPDHLNLVKHLQLSSQISGRGGERYPDYFLDSLLKLLTLALQASTAKRKKELRPSEARRRAAMMSIRTEVALTSLHVANTAAILAMPSAVIHFTNAEAVPSFVVMMFSITLWMKLVSFAHCNADLRSAAFCSSERVNKHCKSCCGIAYLRSLPP